MYIFKRLAVLLSIVVLVGVSLNLAGELSADANGSETREYRWLAGAGVVDFPAPGVTVCELGVPCPDIATASNGDTIEISGEGTLSVHPNSVTGSGSFTHNFAGGGSGSGTWTATQLRSFESYGSPPEEEGLPPTWEAGKAVIRIHLVADGMEADAILTVGCVLPGVTVPEDAFEGSMLNIRHGPNFNHPDLGATLFILQH